MRTLVRLTTTLMALIGVAFIVFGVYLFMSGNITMQKRTEDHNRSVYVDGVLQESRDWTDLLGFEFKINLYDSQYIGR